MKCEKCGKNEATTFFSENINGQKRELHLCGECAKEMNLGNAFENAFQSFGHLWSDPFHSFLGGGFGSLFPEMLGASPAALSGGGRTCPSCGLTERELRQTGRVGCPDCYTAFADILDPYVQKVHGATRHIGAAPAAAEQPKQDPVAALRAQLQQAVASEDYEQAARLRDEIHRLEGEAK